MTKPGDRIELIATDDPNTLLRPGDKGTVNHIGPGGIVGVKWDSGSTLSMLPEEDDWRVLEPGQG